MEESILFDLFSVHCFQMITQKVYSILEKLQLSNLNIGIGFLSALMLLIYIYFRKSCFWIVISIVIIVLPNSELAKLQLELKVLYQLLQMMFLDLQQHYMK